MDDYLRPLDERWGLAALVAIATFGGLVGVGKVLSRWGGPDHKGLVVAFGNVLVSIAGGLLVGFMLIEAFPSRPMLVVGLSGLGAWLGGGLLEPLARRLVDRLQGEVDKEVG